MITNFETYYEGFKPKRLAEREAARSEMLKKKREKMQLFLKEHESKIKEIEADFSLDDVTSEHLEALTEFIGNENKMLDFFIGDLEGDDVNPNVAFMFEERPRIYVMYQALKDNIKVGEFFDYKEEAQLEEYLRQNLNRSYKYAYNAYPGGDGTAVILSKVELKGSEVAIDDVSLKESLNGDKKITCLYLHGLGAEVSQEIKDALSDYKLIYPQINYDGTTQPYYDCLDILNKNKVDFIVGHSVGGVMAYWLAKEKNIATLLLCPAFGDEYTVYVSKQVKKFTPKIMVIIGTDDDEVDSEEIKNKVKNQANCSIIEIESDHDIDPSKLTELVENFTQSLYEIT